MLNKLPSTIRPIPGRPACPLPKPAPNPWGTVTHHNDKLDRPAPPKPAPKPLPKTPGNPFHGEIKPGGPFKVEEGSSLHKLIEKFQKGEIKAIGPFNVEKGSSLHTMIEKFLSKQ